jgi:hypothetical protein
LTSFSEITIWIHSAGTGFEDLLGTSPDLSFRQSENTAVIVQLL